jgi:hypothetical protein
MRRRSRILLNAATAASVSLFVAAVVLWVRNFWVVEGVDWNGSRWFASVSSADCTLELWILPRHVGDREPGWNYGNAANERFFDYFWGVPDFRTDGQLKVAIPYWALSAASAFMGLLGLAGRRLRRKTRPRPECRVCGYDLRATPDRCPECGAVPTTPS